MTEHTKIVSRFYVIDIDNRHIYVGFTNRSVEQRFNEHKVAKDLPDSATIREIDKLEFDFSWDVDTVRRNAKLVSDREAELVEKFETQESEYQKAIGGGTVWTHIKHFIMTNKDNPKWEGISENTILAVIEEICRRKLRLTNVIGDTRQLTRIRNVMGVTVHCTRIRGVLYSTKQASRLESAIYSTSSSTRVNSVIWHTTYARRITSSLNNVGYSARIGGVITKTKQGSRVTNVIGDTRPLTRLKNTVDVTRYSTRERHIIKDTGYTAHIKNALAGTGVCNRVRGTIKNTKEK